MAAAAAARPRRRRPRQRPRRLGRRRWWQRREGRSAARGAKHASAAHLGRTTRHRVHRGMPPRHDVAAQSFAAVWIDRLDRWALGVVEEARPGRGCEGRSAPQRAARQREVGAARGHEILKVRRLGPVRLKRLAGREDGVHGVAAAANAGYNIPVVCCSPIPALHRDGLACIRKLAVPLEGDHVAEWQLRIELRDQPIKVVWATRRRRAGPPPRRAGGHLCTGQGGGCSLTRLRQTAS
jgi:hypothetical protein